MAMSSKHRGFERILVATDFSPQADAALNQALWLARQCHSQVTVAHTVPDLRRVVHRRLLYGEGDEAQAQAELRQQSEARLEQLLGRGDATNLGLKHETFLGEPIVELTRAVRAEEFGLVLAGTRGRSGWTQFFVGSTARRLIRKCPASVWVVKAEHVGQRLSWPRSIFPTSAERPWSTGCGWLNKRTLISTCCMSSIPWMSRKM
jgi:nucleotide-binding universal stress UspA family protein